MSTATETQSIQSSEQNVKLHMQMKGPDGQRG